ncbi:hypothetical protein Dimus_001191 [Dionaea muscipula]
MHVTKDVADFNFGMELGGGIKKKKKKEKTDCVAIQEVPAGKWFLPCCICGLRNPVGDEVFTEIYYQCDNQYHVDCLNKAGLLFSDDNLTNKFCSQSCFEIYARPHELLQTSNPTSVEGLTWTLIRSRRND